MDIRAMYQDIAERTGGDLYIGVVGPVRTGKSTFIQRFLETMVLPDMADEHEKLRTIDEMPVSGAGKTIMTIQPNFVPSEAASIALSEGATARIRLIDCVGYLIKGVLGLSEGDDTRMVRTPWFEHDIPFEKAAELGTRKVIEEHATLGVLVTTDGTVTEFPRSAYVEAEERVVKELKGKGKPFVVLVNTSDPGADEPQRLRAALGEKYGVPVLAMNARNMTEDDMAGLLEALLFEFPLREAFLRLPDWVGALPDTHWLCASLLEEARAAASGIEKVRDQSRLAQVFSENPNVESVETAQIRLAEGGVDDRVALKDGLFYQILGEESGQAVRGEEHLLRLMTEMTQAKRAYDRIAAALASVESVGYGLVPPSMDDMKLEKPELVKQGGRYGVRLRGTAPSLHLIHVDVGAEVSPIVGSQQQAEELIEYLQSEYAHDPAGIWETNVFGKSLSDMMRDGLSGKLQNLPEDVQGKFRDAMGKIVNEGNGGMLCVLF